MKIIVGLGNPGEKYKNTRHNVGFMMMDKFREKYDFPDFELNKKFNAEITLLPYPLLPLGEGARRADEGEVDDEEKIILLRPQTFMNNSGDSVRTILAFYKLTPDDIIIIHDDLDLPLGKYKVASDSSSAGHHGIQDIFDKLATQKITRIRIGIGQVKDDVLVCRLDASDFVLQKFSPEELEKIEKISGEVLEEIEKLI